MVQFVPKRFVVAMVNGVSGRQIENLMIVYGQLDFQKVQLTFRLRLIQLIGAATLQMVSMK